MGSNEERNLAALYDEPYDFSMSVHDDVDTFLNVHEFAAIHTIDGKKVPCVITSTQLRNLNIDGVMTRGLVLLIRDKHVHHAEAGMQVRIDGAVYVVTEAKRIQGEMWRIEMIAGDG